jgi:hypothetical protein
MTPEFNRWWDADELSQTNPYAADSPAFWAWEGWRAAQVHALKTAVQRGIAEFLEHTGQYVTNDASRNAALAAERERCITAVRAADNCECGAPCDCFTVYTAIYAISALGDES